MSSATVTAAAWGADFFGTLNELPSEPVAAIAQILEVMRTEPTFQAARRALLADLQVGPRGRILDAGCGTGAALPDILEVVGPGVALVDGADLDVEAAPRHPPRHLVGGDEVEPSIRVLGDLHHTRRQRLLEPVPTRVLDAR